MNRDKQWRRQSPEQRLADAGLELPGQINESVMASLWHGHPAGLTESELGYIQGRGPSLVADATVHLRSLDGFALYLKDGTLFDATPSLEAFGELILPERKLAPISKLLPGEAGIEQLITVVSRGAFVEYPLQPGQLLIYSEEPELLSRILPGLPGELPWFHLGDLSPCALARLRELAQSFERQPGWILPRDPEVVLKAYGQSLDTAASWQPELLGRTLRYYLQPLIEQGMWVNHQHLVLYPHDTWMFCQP